jgi:hypothetical protein
MRVSAVRAGPPRASGGQRGAECHATRLTEFTIDRQRDQEPGTGERAE